MSPTVSGKSVLYFHLKLGMPLGELYRFGFVDETDCAGTHGHGGKRMFLESDSIEEVSWVAKSDKQFPSVLNGKGQFY